MALATYSVKQPTWRSERHRLLVLRVAVVRQDISLADQAVAARCDHEHVLAIAINDDASPPLPARQHDPLAR